MTLDATGPIVCLVTAGECSPSTYISSSERIFDLVRAAVAAGVDLIQIREKYLSGKLLFALTQGVVDIARTASTKVLLNDRLDIALAAGADGVHLTATSIPVAAARRASSDDLIIGASTHSVAEIREAYRGGADFVIFGPVFPTPGKQSVGIEALATACESADIAVLAIGGVDESNLEQIFAAGAAGFAAIRALNDVDSIYRILEKMRR